MCCNLTCCDVAAAWYILLVASLVGVCVQAYAKFDRVHLVVEQALESFAPLYCAFGKAGSS